MAIDAVSPAGKNPAQAFDDPFFQFNLAENIHQQRESNRRQQAFNRISQRQWQQDWARLGLEGTEQMFNAQRYLHGLLAELAQGRFSGLIQAQQSARGLSDLTTDLASQRYNIERTGLTDQLRLAEAQTLLNDLLFNINPNAPGARARNLLGVRA